MEFFEINTHGKGPNRYVATGCSELPHLVPIAEYALNASEKVFPIIVRVEPDKIRAKQSLQKLPAPFRWNQPEDLKLREGNM